MTSSFQEEAQGSKRSRIFGKVERHYLEGDLDPEHIEKLFIDDMVGKYTQRNMRVLNSYGFQHNNIIYLLFFVHFSFKTHCKQCRDPLRRIDIETLRRIDIDPLRRIDIDPLRRIDIETLNQVRDNIFSNYFSNILFFFMLRNNSSLLLD